MPFQGALNEIRSVVRDRSVVRCGVRPVPAPLLDGGAEPRPAGGTPRRVDGCRRGRLEHPAGFYDAALPGFHQPEQPGRLPVHQLRPVVHRTLRHSGQFLGCPGVGHHQPQEPPVAQGLRLSRVAERRLGVSPAAVRLRGGAERAHRLRHAAPARHGELAADSLAALAGRPAPQPPPAGTKPVPAPTGPTQCHDITVYPAIGLAGGACGGYGLLLDIRDVANPKRIGAVADSNFSYWHSATFNNDGSKLLFSDEWGGGGQPKCRATDKHEWGADALFTVADNRMTFQSYYKMSAPQTAFENCVAHNGSLIPIPGRDVMVQAWYQGGISVFDWTDAAHPKEVAFFDWGPVDATKLADGGSWSAYWYNGYIVSSEIARGLDIFELRPSGLISQNEIDAAKLVHLDYFNTQGQPKIVWPASFVVARAYLAQLARRTRVAPDSVSALRNDLGRAEKLSGQPRRDALTRLGARLDSDASGATDPAKLRTLAGAIKDLAQLDR